MGYTHHYGPKAETPIADWNRALKTIRAAVKNSEVPLCRIYNDRRRPSLCRDHILFNGSGVDGHETFALLRKKQGWSFCKTARKPYDILVCVALLALHAECGLSVSSDGSPQDWEAARTLYNKHAGKPISVDDVIVMLDRSALGAILPAYRGN